MNRFSKQQYTHSGYCKISVENYSETFQTETWQFHQTLTMQLITNSIRAYIMSKHCIRYAFWKFNTVAGIHCTNASNIKNNLSFLRNFISMTWWQRDSTVCLTNMQLQDSVPIYFNRKVIDAQSWFYFLPIYSYLHLS